MKEKITQLVAHGKDIDFLAGRVEMRVAGKSAVKTYVGAILSVCNVSLITVMSIYVFMQYMDTTQPYLAIEASYSTKYPKLDLGEAKLAPVFIAYDYGTTPIPAEDLPKFLTVRFSLWNYTLEKDSSGSEYYKYQSRYFPIVNCGSLVENNRSFTFMEDPEAANKDIVRKFGYCIDAQPGELKLEGSWSDSYSSYPMLEFLPCVLGTDCIDALRLSYLGITLIQTNPYINLSNYEDPVKFSSNSDEYLYLTTNTGQRVMNKMKINEIYDSRGWLSENSLKQRFITIDKATASQYDRTLGQTSCTLAEIDDYSCMPYLYMVYTSGGASEKTTRTYQGITESLGQVGGVKEVLIFMFTLVYILYQQHQYKKVLLNSVYGSFNHEHVKINPDDKDAEKKRLADIKQDKRDKKYKKLAVESIEEVLDITLLAKEINSLKFITDVLLTPEQKKLIPYYTLKKVQEHHKLDNPKATHTNPTEAPPSGNLQFQGPLPTAPLSYTKGLTLKYKNLQTIGGHRSPLDPHHNITQENSFIKQRRSLSLDERDSARHISVFPGASKPAGVECCVKRDIDAKLAELAKELARAKRLASAERGKTIEMDSSALNPVLLRDDVSVDMSNRGIEFPSGGLESVHGDATPNPPSIFSKYNTNKVTPTLKKTPVVKKGKITVMVKNNLNRSQKHD